MIPVQQSSRQLIKCDAVNGLHELAIGGWGHSLVVLTQPEADNHRAEPLCWAVQSLMPMPES